jgi:hypothetical protein
MTNETVVITTDNGSIRVWPNGDWIETVIWPED